MRDDKPTQERVRARLSRVKYPGFPRDIVALGMVAGVALGEGTARIELRLPGGRTALPEGLGEAIAAELAGIGLAADVLVSSGETPGPTGAPAGPQGTGPGVAAEPVTLPGVRAVLAVASAKGGVGKSTVATNLACALAAAGLRTGLLDADVYGPSLPILMGTDARPTAAGHNRFHPVEKHGVRCASMGFFLDESSPVIWRGPMVSGLVRQFLGDCEWGDLDVLVVDLPPGTGDAVLTLAQQVRLSGAVIVTTPQEVALRDVVRGVAMFRQLQVPILGVIENLSGFVCPQCGERDDVFGRDGGARVAAAAGAPLLAEIPIEPEVRASGDAGLPIVLAPQGSPVAALFTSVAARLAAGLGVATPERDARPGP